MIINPWILLGAVLAWGASLVVVGGTAYSRGIETAEGRAAQVRAGELQAAIDGMVKEIEEREKRDEQAAAALQAFDAQMETFGRDMRRMAGACVPTPERLRIFQRAADAANATGFAGPLPSDPSTKSR